MEIRLTETITTADGESKEIEVTIENSDYFHDTSDTTRQMYPRSVLMYRLGLKAVKDIQAAIDEVRKNKERADSIRDLTAQKFVNGDGEMVYLYAVEDEEEPVSEEYDIGMGHYDPR